MFVHDPVYATHPPDFSRAGLEPECDEERCRSGTVTEPRPPCDPTYGTGAEVERGEAGSRW